MPSELADNLSATPPTYPEQRTYPWEANPRITRATATDILRRMAKQGGSATRKAALNAAADTLDEIADERMIDEFTGAQVKKVLIAAAHDHGWWGRSMTRFKLPEAPAPDTKACYRCKEIKPRSEFETAPTAQQVKAYGWRPDTIRRRISPLCATCRKANADKKRRKQVRANRKREMPYELAMRMQAFERVRKQINEHLSRVRAAIHIARKPLRTINEDTGELEILYDYQFKNTDVKEYYLTKRDMLEIARHRLNELLGETAPIPTRWGQLLTKEEAHNLQTLHNQAYINDRKPPALW